MFSAAAAHSGWVRGRPRRALGRLETAFVSAAPDKDRFELTTGAVPWSSQARAALEQPRTDRPGVGDQQGRGGQPEPVHLRLSASAPTLGSMERTLSLALGG